MTNTNITNNNINGWSVLFNVPNIISWIRIILLFTSIRYFGQRKYLLFVIYHTISGFLDSFDGALARSLDQQSVVGKYFEFILDQYSHYIMYVGIGLLYPSYIVYFYLEFALEIWNSTYDLYVHSLSKSDLSWLHKSSPFVSFCSISIHDSPNLRLLNWYGPDVFHTVLIIRYLLFNDNDRKLIGYVKRYISPDKIRLFIGLILCFTGFFAILRTSVTSCYMFDKLYRMACAG